MTNLHFERLTDTAHPLYEKAIELYRISFPYHEQRETPSRKRILEDEAYHFELLFDDTTFVGLVLYWEATDFLYVEHFCILPEMRGRKYGQTVLEMLANSGKPIILEIDPPIDEVSRRRKCFYERCGFAENPYPHMHPPYHRGNEGHALVVMTYPKAIAPQAYETFNMYLREHIMNRAFS